MAAACAIKRADQSPFFHHHTQRGWIAREIHLDLTNVPFDPQDETTAHRQEHAPVAQNRLAATGSCFQKPHDRHRFVPAGNTAEQGLKRLCDSIMNPQLLRVLELGIVAHKGMQARPDHVENRTDL